MSKIVKILTILLLAATCSFANWAGGSSEPENTKKIDGKGFYVITNADELAWFAEQVNGGRSDINAVLANDIVFGSSETTVCTKIWTPIGKDSTHQFAGTLDGAGYMIYGLYVDSYIAGLVGFLNRSGILKNLKMANGQISGSKYVGGLVGKNDGGNIENIENKNVVTVSISTNSRPSYTYIYVGGIAGINRGSITNCINRGRVTSSFSYKSVNGNLASAYYLHSYTGGIAGYGGSFSGCYNESSVSSSVDYSDEQNSSGYLSHSIARSYAGGIVGYSTGGIVECGNSGSIYSKSNAKSLHTLKDVEITHTYSTAESKSYAGGIVGYRDSGQLSKCFNTGSVSSTANISSQSYLYDRSLARFGLATGEMTSECYRGGIVGRNRSFNALSHCFNRGSAGLSSDESVKFDRSFDIDKSEYWLDEIKYTGVAENMQRDQFAWMLNTSNGTFENSGVWTRGTDGYPTFANADSLPIYRVVFNDEGITSNRYTNYLGYVSFPDNPEPPEGSIFTGWFNEDDVKVKSTTKFSADQIINAVYTDASDVYWNINFYNADSTLLETQSVQHGGIVEYKGSTPNFPTTAQYTYTFAGWNVEPTNATENFDYYAVYDSTLNSYKVIFQDYDKKELASSTYKYGATPSYTENLTRASTVEWNYSHVGWTPAITAVTGESVYTAVYDSSKVEYTVTFMNGKEVLETLKVPYGLAAIPSVTPTREGYKFVSWSPQCGYIISDLIVKAMFEELIYHTITIKNENGEIIDNVDVEENGKLTLPSAAEKTGYKFEGWYDNKGNYLGQPGDIITISADISIEARYSVLSYTITFVDDNGAIIESGSVEFGTMPTAPADPSKASTAQYNYEFAGWSPAVAAVSGNATYTATYNAVVRNYTITFVDEDGKTISSSSLAYGKMPVASEEPVKASTAQYNFTFAGWTPELVKVAGNATYKATFASTLRNYTVTFVDDDGTEISKSSVAYGRSPSVPADPFKASTAQYTYEFAGWSPAVAVVSGNATYTATYASKTRSYEVTFVDEDGSVIETASVEYGKKPTAPSNPEKTATAKYRYEFAGWFPEIATVKGKATYTATYDAEVKSYTVTFVDEDGTEISKSSVAYGRTPSVPADPFKASTAQYTYEFAGWTPAVSMVTGNVTYTASYNSVLNAYMVTFLDYDGSTLKSQNVKYGAAATAPVDPERDGYKFIGWDNEFDEIVMNLDVTAQYEKLSSSSSSRSDVKPESSSAGDKPASSSSEKGESSSSEKGDALIDVVGVPHFTVSTVGRNIQIGSARIGSAYAVVDMQGRMLKSGRVNASNFNVVMSSAGTFLVRVGNQTRKVNIK